MIPVWNGLKMEEEIHRAIVEVYNSFPFKGYMDGNEPKYLWISKILLREAPRGSRVLDVGCGPCDLTAILARLGYQMVGVDDLKDPWHLVGDNRKRIMDFAQRSGITLMVEPIEKASLKQNSFDAALLIDILEHYPNPRFLLNRVISALKPSGLLLIGTPNAVALAKRVFVVMGKSNYPNVNFVYFNVGDYRGHVREYTVEELKRILKLSGLTEVTVKLTNHDIQGLLRKSRGLRKLVTGAYLFISSLYPKFRASIIIYGRKPEGWRPISDLDAIEHLKVHYPHVVKYNLDGEPDELLIKKLKSRLCNPTSIS